MMNQGFEVTRDTTKVVRYSNHFDVEDTIALLKPKAAMLIEVEEPLMVLNTDLRQEIQELDKIVKEKHDIVPMQTVTFQQPVLVKAFSDDAICKDVMIPFVVALTTIYIIGSYSKWKAMISEIKSCIFVA